LYVRTVERKRFGERRIKSGMSKRQKVIWMPKLFVAMIAE